MKTETFTYSDFINWYRSKYRSLQPDPTMWRKYVEYIDNNRSYNTYCSKTIESYESIKTKISKL